MGHYIGNYIDGFYFGVKIGEHTGSDDGYKAGYERACKMYDIQVHHTITLPSGKRDWVNEDGIEIRSPKWIEKAKEIEELKKSMEAEEEIEDFSDYTDENGNTDLEKYWKHNGYITGAELAYKEYFDDSYVWGFEVACRENDIQEMVQLELPSGMKIWVNENMSDLKSPLEMGFDSGWNCELSDEETDNEDETFEYDGSSEEPNPEKCIVCDSGSGLGHYIDELLRMYRFNCSKSNGVKREYLETQVDFVETMTYILFNAYEMLIRKLGNDTAEEIIKDSLTLALEKYNTPFDDEDFERKLELYRQIDKK